MEKTKKTLLPVFCLIMTALAMRAPMAMVGPLINQGIRADLGLSSTVAGFLTTIPLLIFAVTAPTAGRIAAKADLRALFFCCLGGCLAGMLARSFLGTAGLFIGTVMIGLSIGMLNVTMPAWIRHQFPGRIGTMMGIYSTAMTASSAVAAGAAQPLMTVLNGWRGSLATPSALCVIALAVLAAAASRLLPRLPELGGSGKIHVLPRYVAIALFMGIQSFMFFSLLAWFPSIVQELCPGMPNPGILMSVLQAMSLLPSLLLPMAAARVKRKNLLAFGSALVYGLGFAVLAFFGGSRAGILTATILMGLGCGGTLSMGLTLIALQGRNAAETAKISGFAQCVGYLFASLGPTGFGYLNGLAGTWRPVPIILLVLTVVMMVMGLLTQSMKGEK